MKIIAKTIKGKEFIHSTKTLDIYIAPDSSAIIMLDIMNNTRYRLKNDNEIWHIYDPSFPVTDNVEYKLSIYRGILKAKRI